MAEQFQVGDTVRLKSGGPIMTITYVGDDKAVCEWFTPDMKSSSGTFPLAALAKVESDW